ncbi:MAG TPA: error-prone DNA polymerase [Methylibium sp.]
MPEQRFPPKLRPERPPGTLLPLAPGLPGYAELHCRSNFSFLTGASHPEELVARALELGYAGLGLTDECSVAGVVRAHTAIKGWSDEQKKSFRFIVGSEFDVQPAGDTPGCRLVLLAQTRQGYGNLSELITLARLRAGKGEYRLDVRDLDSITPGSEELCGMPECWALLIPRREDPPEVLQAQAHWLKATFGERARIAIELLMWADDASLAERLKALSATTGIPLAAAGDVLMHVRSRKPLQDVLTATRLKQPVAECGFALARNAEQHLRSRLKLAQLYRQEWLEETVRMAEACRFSLAELGYEYPDEIVPEGATAIGHLRKLTEQGMHERYPDGVPDQVEAQIEKELELIAYKRYEAFFLTVHDIVRFARSKEILCQGRGSAANSAVCYCLGITAVNPMDTRLLFERFISRERDEAPDIDVDFEHERREEVIQYVYGKYGQHRTALAAALATYRTRGAVRDVGKALGLDPQLIDAMAKSFQWFDDKDEMLRRFVELGIDPAASVTRHWVELIGTLQGFPRHLSQHTGGFVIARDKLSRMVPIETAAMENRRVIQWDKDDLESLGLLKVDVLALGMLTVLRRSLDFYRQWRGREMQLYGVPQDDEPTYDMICKADTVGVFQIESRAQQSMLPRLRPRKLYDLVIEVAIVRPGPIQGGMVHPYLKRRDAQRAGKLEPSPYPQLDVALERTLGIPIFQEQVMQICVIAAGFTPGEADELRRAMAAWKRKGGVHKYRDRILEGMKAKGYDEAFAEAIFKQIMGFGDYGFPESHAYSFALLAYVSSWLKCHEPAIFLAAMLNSQPMGFYGPSQLVQDAKRHGVEVRPVDVVHSDHDCTLEPRADSEHPAVRLGLCMISAVSKESTERLMAARREHPFVSIEDLALRARIDTRELQALARADALASLAGHRREQTWIASGQELPPALLAEAPTGEAALALPQAPEGEEILLDYAATGLSLRRHPLALLRPRLARRGWRSADELKQARDGQSIWACGIVTMRQQPQTAKGTIFVTLEDETGSVNVIVWERVRKQHRHALLRSRLLAVAGEWQNRENVPHLIARRLVDVTPWLGRLATTSRDFH